MSGDTFTHDESELRPPDDHTHAWQWRGDHFERLEVPDPDTGKRWANVLTKIRYRCTRCGWWQVLDTRTGAERFSPTWAAMEEER